MTCPIYSSIDQRVADDLDASILSPVEAALMAATDGGSYGTFLVLASTRAALAERQFRLVAAAQQQHIDKQLLRGPTIAAQMLGRATIRTANR